MEATIHLRDGDQLAATFTDHRDGQWLEIDVTRPNGERERVTLFIRTDQRNAVAAALREAADAMEIHIRRVRCTRCGVNFDNPDGRESLDGNPRCEECTEAVEQELAAIPDEDPRCHRDDQ